MRVNRMKVSSLFRVGNSMALALVSVGGKPVLNADFGSTADQKSGFAIDEPTIRFVLNGLHCNLLFCCRNEIDFFFRIN